LKEDLNPVQIENRKLKTLKKYNSELKEIAAILKIDQKITSYTARHSYATNLKFIGVSTEVISQSMGHQDVATTNAYLKKFDLNIVDDEVDKLLEEPLFKYAS
jgi:integrase/recombinase XerD